RVNALESQVANLTGQVETATHRLQQLDDAFAAYKRTTDARLKALEDGVATPGAVSATPPPVATTPGEPSRPAPRPTPTPTPAPAKTDAAR
ncbi:hypothetical protein ABI059_15340, partial [Enterococcus faecium]